MMTFMFTFEGVVFERRVLFVFQVGEQAEQKRLKSLHLSGVQTKPPRWSQGKNSGLLMHEKGETLSHHSYFIHFI